MDNLHPQPQQKDKRKTTLIIVVLLAICIVCFLGLIALGSLGYLTYSQMPESVNQSNKTNSTNSTSVSNSTNSTNTTKNEAPKAEIKKTFVGTHLTATIPEDWNIVEYSNSSGMNQFVDNGSTFSGLTGIEVLDENNNIVFDLGGIDGIGGGSGCSTLAQFNDTELSYIQNIKEETELYGDEPTKVIDLTKEVYTEINTLNLRLRRVGNKMYVAKNFSQSFNTSCGIEEQFVKLDELKFTIKDGADTYSANAYKFEINESVLLESTLIKLDEVLLSLKAKSAS